jgi:hypothetical protein
VTLAGWPRLHARGHRYPVVGGHIGLVIGHGTGGNIIFLRVVQSPSGLAPGLQSPTVELGTIIIWLGRRRGPAPGTLWWRGTARPGSFTLQT